MSFNKVILHGNLARDIEIRYLATGTAVGEFSIAVNKKWKTQDGEQKEKCSFIDCTVFGDRAVTMGDWFAKGGAILIEGELTQDQWEDRQTGQKRSKLKVIVNSFDFVGDPKGQKSRERNEEALNQRGKIDPADVPVPRGYKPPPVTADGHGEDVDDSDAPF